MPLPPRRSPRAGRRRSGIRFTDRGRSLVAAGLTLAVAGALLGFVDLVRIGAVLVLLPPLSVAVSLWRRPDVTVHRHVTPSPVPHGATAAVVTTVGQSAARGQGACVAEEEVTPAGRSGSGAPYRQRFAVPALAPGGSARLHYELTPQRRGVHRLGPLRLTATDPFGVAHLHATVPETTEFVALTPWQALSGTVDAAVGAEALSRSGAVRPGTGDPSVAVREYHHGDDPRRINWKATARSGELLVRLDEQATARRAVLLLDQRLGSAALDWAVEALASVAHTLAASGHVLHLVRDDVLHDPAHAAPASADALTVRLSTAQTSTDDDPARTNRLRELATDLAAEGGLLVAAVPAHPRLAATYLTGRPARATGLAFLVHGPAGPLAGTEHTAAALPPDDVLPPTPGGAFASEPSVPSVAETSGWHTVHVTPGHTTVQQAWTQLGASLDDVGGRW